MEYKFAFSRVDRSQVKSHLAVLSNRRKFDGEKQRKDKIVQV